MTRSDTRGFLYASPPASEDAEADDDTTTTETRPSEAVSNGVGPSPADD